MCIGKCMLSHITCCQCAERTFHRRSSVSRHVCLCRWCRSLWNLRAGLQRLMQELLPPCISPHRYDAACLLLVYGVYIIVLCFDLRISEFVLRKLSPCCTCLGKGPGGKAEVQPLMGWSENTSLRVHSRSRTDSGIFQDDSGYSHLSLSLHGLNEISDGSLISSLQVFHSPRMQGK